MKKSFRFCALLGALFVLGFSASSNAQTCPAFGSVDAQVQAAEQALFAPELEAPQQVEPQQVQQCQFCNLTGYSACDSLQGQSCGVEGSSRRCYLYPACACEWSVCRCSSGTWNCFY